jgi:C-3',4' desaturase CrtD
MKRILIIGAGFGGLAAAAELSRRGHDITMLEANVYPGGSAGTFFHRGYRFDAGATLAGGFAPGAVMDNLGRHFKINWQSVPDSKAMLVHLPYGSPITRWTEKELWKTERITHFGEEGEQFWDWQETTADVLWDLALRLPPWPPQTMEDLMSLTRKGFEWFKRNFQIKDNRIFSLFSAAINPVEIYIPPTANKLRQFIDGQLLISAQTTSRFANALYSSAALDLARQGVAHVPGGMGGMADKLVAVIKRNGGGVHFRQEVTRVSKDKKGYFLAETKRKATFQADVVIFNLPPWNIAQLLKEDLPERLRRLPEKPKDGWGAFVLYVGLDNSRLPEDIPLHHQVIAREPLGEGNSIFISLSPEWDHDRAPHSKRALTISTHTRLHPWWQQFNNDQEAYEDRKVEYMERILQAGEKVIPNLRSAAELTLPGTPITFQRFTRRFWGWVGGYPQTNLFRNWGPRLAPDLWMVGDSVFPGQSVPAVMLAGLRVAHAVEAKESLLDKRPIAFKYTNRAIS